jgi:hypothetical protein
MPNLILLFNHSLTPEQAEDATRSLGIAEFVRLPEDIRKLWQQVPADLGQIKKYLEPLSRWLRETGIAGDFVLIQGDFGATYLTIQLALELNLVPIYATTAREAVETAFADGTIQKTQLFRHVLFRRYGE